MRARGLSANFALILLFGTFNGLGAGVVATDLENQDAHWSNSGIQTDVWQQLPGAGGQFGQLPSSGSADPYVYQSREVCTIADNAIFPACANALPACTAAADGVPIYWYKQLANGGATGWTFHSGPVCIYGEKPRDILAEIAAQISREFQQTPIAAATIASQPGPHALRGAETNFYADANEQSFQVTLLGQKVNITATPVAYTWNYGDGTVRGPSPSHGARLPDERVGEQTRTSHAYTSTGTFTISLTTHFNGSYSVNNGPVLPIPGQGNIASNPLQLTIWRAITKNYADDCNSNPQGVGC